jgi:hypothetical protein
MSKQGGFGVVFSLVCEYIYYEFKKKSKNLFKSVGTKEPPQKQNNTPLLAEELYVVCDCII